MSVSSRFSRSCLKVLLAAAAATCQFAEAQTTPQLLPYTSRLLAGGGTVTIAKGATCPSSGLTSTDAYGDGCLATEIQLSSAGATTAKPYGVHYAVADTQGVIYFSDATAGLVRRIDPNTGVVTAFAGGASTSPASNTACGSYTSADARGDGCLSTAVHLTYPMGLAIAANGDLIFTDVGQYDVRRVAAVAGVLPAAGGVISNVAGYAAGGASYGYMVSNATTIVNAATQSYLDAPYNVAIDSQGDILVDEEYKNAILAINPGATATLVAGVTVAPGAIIKITGESTASGYTGTPYCPNGTSGTFGCNYGAYTEGASANVSYLDSSYAVAVDPKGSVYIANEYTNSIPVVSAAGLLTTYAGMQSKDAKTTARGVAGTFAMGSSFGLVADPYSNLYITDAVAGVVWRVDAAGKYQYVVAGGAASPCSSASDSYGDGCPATQAIFGSTGTTYATAASPGIFGVTVDGAGNLYTGDTVTNLVREISTNTQFGNVGGTNVTQTLDIHFAAGDTPSANAYKLTQTNNNFSLGSATCTANSDTTTDCLLPVTATNATSSNLGSFTATLTVTSTAGGANTFMLTGTHVQSPATRTSVSVSGPAACSGATSYSTATAFTLTATIVSTGSPGGTVQFYANNVPIGSPVSVMNSVATLSYTFATANTYTISARYSGDTYFTASSGTSGVAITTTSPSFGVAMASAPTSGAVAQGGTAVYGLTLTQQVYSGTLSFAVSGLPANTTASFSPSTITATGCSTTNTVVLSLQTMAPSVKQAGFGSGIRRLRLVGMLLAVLLAIWMGASRRRRHPLLRLGLIAVLLLGSAGLSGCGVGALPNGPVTPTGTYSITVTVTGTSGSPASSSFQLTVNPYTSPY